jgi:hypothetical protein
LKRDFGRRKGVPGRRTRRGIETSLVILRGEVGSWRSAEVEESLSCDKKPRQGSY